MYKIQPKTLFIGKNIVYLPTCHSTNDYASQKIQNEELSDGTIVITDKQTAGRGQRGNIWLSEPRKNLTFTLLLRPHFLPLKDHFQLNMAVSIAIFEVLSTVLGKQNLSIKWPNDIFYEDKKIGGILIESLISAGKYAYCLVGIGLNVNQTDFHINTASSLKNILGMECSLSELLTTLSERIESNYFLIKNGNTALLKNNFEQYLYRKDAWHKFRKDGMVFDGKIKGITELGELIIETHNDLLQLGNKEFEYII